MFTDKQVAEVESLAKVMVDPLISAADKKVLAEMLRARHQVEGSL